MSDHVSHIGQPVLGANLDMGIFPHSCGPPILGGLHESGKQFRVKPHMAFEAFMDPHYKLLCLLYAMITLSFSLSSPSFCLSTLYFTSFPIAQKAESYSPSPDSTDLRWSPGQPPRCNMATVKVVSYNVRGMCSPNKRNRLWLELRRLGAQVLFLQETHFTDSSLPQLPTYFHNGT